MEENLGVTVASIPTVHGMFLTAALVIQRGSKSLRSLLGRRATSAGEVEDDDLEVSKSRRTIREYYELREVPPAGQIPNEATFVMDQGSEKV